MKKIIIPDNIKQITDTIDLSDGYIIGINGFSVNTNYNISIDELASIIDLFRGKELFISLNKNIENNDLDKLKDILLKLNNYPIKGVLYSDVCFLNFKELLNYDLVWAQEHLTLNYETINYWFDFGVNYTYISSDITLEDIIKIKKNTKSKLLVNIFGYLPMFVSKRHIVKNYLNKFHINDKSNIYYMEKEQEVYPIIDNEFSTQVYSSKVLNGIKELNTLEENNIEYVVLNGFLIENAKFKQVVEVYCHKKQLDISKIILDTFDGFMYQDTISKVKKND